MSRINIIEWTIEIYKPEKACGKIASHNEKIMYIYTKKLINRYLFNAMHSHKIIKWMQFSAIRGTEWIWWSFNSDVCIYIYIHNASIVDNSLIFICCPYIWFAERVIDLKEKTEYTKLFERKEPQYKSHTTIPLNCLKHSDFDIDLFLYACNKVVQDNNAWFSMHPW